MAQAMLVSLPPVMPSPANEQGGINLTDSSTAMGEAPAFPRLLQSKMQPTGAVPEKEQNPAADLEASGNVAADTPPPSSPATLAVWLPAFNHSLPVGAMLSGATPVALATFPAKTVATTTLGPIRSGQLISGANSTGEQSPAEIPAGAFPLGTWPMVAPVNTGSGTGSFPFIAGGRSNAPGTDSAAKELPLEKQVPQAATGEQAALTWLADAAINKEFPFYPAETITHAALGKPTAPPVPAKGVLPLMSITPLATAAGGEGMNSAFVTGEGKAALIAEYGGQIPLRGTGEPNQTVANPVNMTAFCRLMPMAADQAASLFSDTANSGGERQGHKDSAGGDAAPEKGVVFLAPYRLETAPLLYSADTASVYLDHQAIIRQVVDQAFMALQQGRQEMHIRLKPEQLGNVTLHVTVQDGQVSALFCVENAAVQQVLQNSLGQLRQQLTGQGFDVQYLAVSTGFNRDFAQQAHTASFSHRASRRELRDEPVAAVEQTALPVIRPLLQAGHGIIDYRI